MNERRDSLILAFVPTLAVCFALAGFGAGYFLWGRPERAGDLGKIKVALERIESRYYGNVSRETLIDGALEGMTSKLDPYCEYFTVQEWQEFDSVNLKGKFGGVGILVESDRATGYLNIITPIEDTPAFKADILPGDQVREVDGKSIKGLPLQDVIRRIKGPPDTAVTLTIARKGKDLFKVTLTRAIIQVKAVKARMLEDGLAYLRITDFTEMMELFDREVQRLQEQGIKGMVIDLRFNGGGLLNQCVELADRFLEEGVIVSTRTRGGEEIAPFKAKKGNTLPNFPLVVLVNEGTASASEIFAGAMKDHGRGVIIGERTFGKGSVQTPFPLPDGAHLKLTTAHYFTPNGVSVHREEGKKEFGIEPHYRVDMSREEYAGLIKKWNDERVVKGEKPPEPSKFRDYQLEAGLEVLRARLAGREPKVEARVLPKEKASEN